MACDELIDRLRGMGSEANRQGMARYGINTERAFGVPMSRLRPMAREIGRNPALAEALWATGCHEARILAVLIDDPSCLTRARALAWAGDFDSWDVCDCCCGNLFDKAPFALELALELAERPEEFVRRAGFSLLVALTVHAKKLPDSAFVPFLDVIERHADDPRNFVKKAVNWALRQIGKRSLGLYGPALTLARQLAASQDPSRRWVGRDAARELSDPKTVARLYARADRVR